jgi:hypothetical protein
MKKTKMSPKTNGSRNEWNSQLVQKIEYDFNLKRSSFERLEFLISLFLDYRINHSHGEYDIYTIIDDKTETERTELSDFLEKGFREMQIDLGFGV